MSSDRPSSRELRPGMTVRIRQHGEAEPIVGEIGTIRSTDDPEGVEVKLQSGAVGLVQAVVHDE